MDFEGLPLFLIAAIIGTIVLLLVLFRFAESRTLRRLLSALMVFLLSCALVVIARAIPLWLPDTADDFIAVITLQIALILWWMALANAVIRSIETFIWRGLFSNQQIPKLLRDVCGAIVYIVALFAIVAFVFDQPVTGLLATSGVVAVVLGFALQNTLSDVFSGIALNMEHPYRQGDWIRLDDRVEGEVVEVNWRATHLRSREDTEIILPNSSMAAARLINFHYPSPQYAFNVQVRLDLRTPPARAKAVLRAAALACPGILRQPGPIPRLIRFEDSVALYDIKVWARDFGRHPDYLDQIFCNIWEHLRWAGIDVSYPHSYVHLIPTRERDQTTPLDVGDLVEQIDLFAALEPDEKAALTSKLRHTRFSPGTAVVEQGAAGQSLFIVAEGLLEVLVRHTSGEDRKVADVGPGNFFGEMSLLTGEPRSATVRAQTDGVVYEIDKSAMEPILRARPGIAGSLSTAIARRKAELTSAASDAGRDAARTPDHATYGEQILRRIRNFFQL